MLRISPSLIDSYRYWRSTDFADSDRERQSLEDLLASIRREKIEPSEAMNRGKAWHIALEQDPGSGDVVEVKVTGEPWLFDAGDVRAIRSRVSPGMHVELRGTLELPEVDVVMHLRSDGVCGNRIDEHKTTSRIDADRYTSTMQWRAYLLAFGCRMVVYHVVRLRRDRKSKVWGVSDYLPFTQYAYPSMREDLAREAGEVAAFIRQQGLTEYREEKQHAYDF